MNEISTLSKNERELLNIIGRHPELSPEELLQYTNYKRAGTIQRKLKRLKELQVLDGPLYDLNYSKLCKNPLRKLFCTIETSQSFETVIPYLKLIDSIGVITPLLSLKNILLTTYYSSNDAEIGALFQLLKDHDIITDYHIRVEHSKRMVENPNVFGDINPPLENLLDPCDIPDMSLKPHDTDWNECDISIIPYLRYGGHKLIEMLRKENKQYRNWTYEQVRYAREKMLKHGLIEKVYWIYPIPESQSTLFHLFFEVEDTELTTRILYNFAKGAQLYKEYSLCGNGGWILCLCHISFLTGLMRNLDHIDEIKEKEICTIRSHCDKYAFGKCIELKYFDFDNQTLEYPYEMYREKIKERLEQEFPAQELTT